MIAFGRNPMRFAVATARSQAFRIEIEALRLDIGDDRRRAKQRHHFGRRVVGEGRTNYRIARPDFPRHENEKERIGTARATDGVPRAAECGKFGLERPHFRAQDELAMRQHARHRLVDGAAETAALRRDIDEWDRLVVNPGVLIHDWNVISLSMTLSENRNPLFGVMP